MLHAEALKALYESNWGKTLVILDTETFEGLVRQALAAIDPHAVLPTRSTPKG